MNRKIKSFAIILFACTFVLGIETIVSAQGRGRGQGGRPAGVPGGGPPSGGGVGRGSSTSSDRANGGADVGRSTASDRANGRSETGLERATLQRENSAQANRDLRDHPEMAGRLHTTAKELRHGYQRAFLIKPKFN